MKNKFSSIWHLALALILVLGFSLAPAIPALADAAPPTVSSAATNAVGTIITITFNKPMADPVGNVAAFLLSDLAAGISAEITYVDGGFSHVMGASSGAS